MANIIIVSILLIGYTLFTVTYGQLDLYRRVCYFPSWKHARLGPTQFSPDNITDPTLCTHIVIAFAGVDPQSFNIKPLQYDEDGPTGLWRNMTNIKLRSPFTKILLAVGGWDFGVLPFSKLVETDTGIDSFAINAANFLRERNFDGLDIDWEYPGQFGSPAGDKYRFTLLLKVISQRFKQESVDRGLPRLLLSVAVPVEKEFVDQGFEIPKISRHVDFINLMSYDMYGPWGEVIGHHSALYGKPGDTPYMAPRNVNWVVNYWIDKGMPYDKIVVGVPFYGRTFATINQTTHEPGVSFKSGGIGGPYTQSNGLIGAFELCQVLNDYYYS
ncbi:hypothetical protein SNE40_005241 [Patella caerulea]|uniref:GH18 domain-containing protein n=1 Tax=Patella caerulea TaxID=87958 RepID=A0AAN8PZS0_PATCE